VLHNFFKRNSSSCAKSLTFNRENSNTQEVESEICRNSDENELVPLQINTGKNIKDELKNNRKILAVFK
jgi:hypothetical protein